MDFESINQYMMDNISQFVRLRWSAFAACVILYVCRVYMTQSHQIVTYIVGIYLVHGFILFATPKNTSIPDPFEEEDDNYEPININNDLRPFIRNMPEYQYWLFCIKTVMFSFFLTFFSITDIPVFTPVLVIYFISMVGATAYKLYLHAKKYNYNPFVPVSKQFKNKIDL